jgi:di/tricarboxylate transporter
MTASGAAQRLADLLVDVVGDSGPYPLLVGVFVVTAVLGQLVKGPGGYRFTDYARLGLPLMAWYFVVAVAIVPVFWSL